MGTSPSKVVMVTGAAAGIGLACCKRFASEGYGIVINDIPGKALDKVVSEFSDTGTQHMVIPGDISSPEITQEISDSIASTWGRVDALIANAGVQDAGGILDTDDAHWSRVISVNLMGVAHASKAILPFMLEQGGGALVMIASVNAVTGCAGMAAYDASKNAVLGLMRSLAIDYGANNVRVNAISPGNTLTDYHINRMAQSGIGIDELRDMTRGYGLLERAAEPAEIASAAYFLCSNEASFITGHNMVVDGGYSLQKS